MEYPKIIGVEATPIEIRGERAFAISEGQTRTHKSVVVRIITDEPNIDGVAEIVCAPPGKPEEIQHEICGALKALVDSALVGISAENTQSAQRVINERIKGKVWTKGGLNVALSDLRAKALGVSCMSMLGVHCEDAKVPVIGTVIGIMDPDQMAERARELLQSTALLELMIVKDVESTNTIVRQIDNLTSAANDTEQDNVDQLFNSDASANNDLGFSSLLIAVSGSDLAVSSNNLPALKNILSQESVQQVLDATGSLFLTGNSPETLINDFGEEEEDMDAPDAGVHRNLDRETQNMLMMMQEMRQDSTFCDVAFLCTYIHILI